MRKRRWAVLAAFCAVASATPTAWASPATFVTALPVALDQILARVNANTSFAATTLGYAQFPVSVALGVTSSLAIFTTLQQGFSSLNLPAASGASMQPTRASSGERDVLAFARYTLFKIDRPKTSLRIAPLAGASLPTGSNTLADSQGLLPGPLQTGSGTVDPYVGITMGYNGTRYGSAWDATYRWNPAAAHGFTPGDEARTDGEIEMRLLPVHLPDEGLPKELWIVLETNLIHDRRATVDGAVSPNSGGITWNGAATLQLPTLHWELGAGVLLPIEQRFNGSGEIAEGKGFLSFFEYYLSAPSWKRFRRPR